MKNKLIRPALAFVVGMIFNFNVFAADDPLPSWNDTAPKPAIIAFVEKVTKPGSPDFVPVAERIATFDNDGTLWAEFRGKRRISTADAVPAPGSDAVRCRAEQLNCHRLLYARTGGDLKLERMNGSEPSLLRNLPNGRGSVFIHRLFKERG